MDYHQAYECSNLDTNYFSGAIYCTKAFPLLCNIKIYIYIFNIPKFTCYNMHSENTILFELLK